MYFDLTQIIICFAALLIASVVQSAIGFGMGLLAGPILLWAGLELHQTVMVIVSATVLQCSFTVYRIREHMPWRSVFSAVSVRITGMVLGLYIMTYVAGVQQSVIRQYVGYVLLAAVVAQGFALRHGLVVDKIPLPLSIAAFFTSGVMAGFCAMGGPPLVLWVNSLKWPSTRMRGFLLGSFALSGLVQVLLLCGRFGQKSVSGLLVGLICIPGMLLGTTIGLRLGKLINAAMLRIIGLIMLAILALSSIIAPWLV